MESQHVAVIPHTATAALSLAFTTFLPNPFTGMESILCPRPSCSLGVMRPTGRKHGKHTFAIEYLCAKCSQPNIYVCLSCRRDSHRNDYVFQNYDSMRKHGRIHHYSVKKQRLHPQVEEGDPFCFLGHEDDDDTPCITACLNYSFPNANTQSYVCTGITESRLKAVVHMVLCACYGSHHVLPEHSTAIDLEDVYLFLAIARLVIRVGSVNTSMLSTVLLIMGRKREDNRLPIPLSVAQISSVITNRSRKYSLYSLLPLPSVIPLGQLNACVSLQETLAHSIAFADTTVLLNEKFQKIVECPKAQLVLNSGTQLLNDHKNTYIVLLIFWFDGWDAASSLTKANKNPIWSGVITMIFVDHNYTLVTAVTRLMAVGPGKGDHTPVLQKLNHDYFQMRRETNTNTYYSQPSQSWKKLLPCILFLWCDQPEKRSICGLLAGNSTFGSCFGYSCNFQQLFKSIEACNKCRGLLLTYTQGSSDTPFPHTACNMCWQWELPAHASGSLYQYREPVFKNFPLGVFPGHNLNLEAGKVDTILLGRAWKHAFDSFVEGAWTSTQVKDYLGLLLINDKTIQVLVDTGKRVILYGYAIGPPTLLLDQASIAGIISEHDLHPEKYKMPPHPPMWDLLNLDDLLEVPMHMMGIVKAVSKLVHIWAQKVGCRTLLVSHLNVLIHMHQRFCRIGRHPFAAYSKDNTYPGWVSDTFRTWYQLMPWMYQCVSLPEFKYESFQEPDTPWRGWTKPTCTSYCAARGVVGAKNMLIADLKEIIYNWKQRAGGVPPCHVPFANKVTGRDIREMIWYCHSTFKFWLCTGTDSSHNLAMVNAKLFLSKINDIDKMVNKGEASFSKPIYLAKYNLISLMRAMSQLKEYDSGRYVHEGGPEGEGIVKELRPLVPAGLKCHFAKNLIDSWNRDREILRSSRIIIGDGNALSQDIIHLTTHLSSMNPFHVENDVKDGDINEGSWPRSFHFKVEQAEKLTLEYDDIPGLEDETVHSDVYAFCRYDSYRAINKFVELGLPISVVFVKVSTGNIKMGAVVGKRGEWYLYPIQIGHVQLDDEFGFTYFAVASPEPDQVPELMLRNKVKETIFPIQNYAFLLPNLTLSGGSLECNSGCSYALLTAELYHLNPHRQFTR